MSLERLLWSLLKLSSAQGLGCGSLRSVVFSPRETPSVRHSSLPDLV